MHLPTYRPLTANPFRRCATYDEWAPCPALRPYVRCFWAGEFGGGQNPVPQLIIPDTCVDIIYHIDHTAGTVNARFCGVNDSSFYAYTDQKPGCEFTVFGIRFYAWSAYLFSEDSLTGTVNGAYDAREHFSWLDRELRGRLPELRNPAERIRFTEKLLLKKLEFPRDCAAVDAAVGQILFHRGTWEVSRLSRESFLSTRQLERLFHEYIGITPKKLSNLIRYQFLWNDVVALPGFDVLDAVLRYGYSDLAHLTREFKRYHSMDIRTARLLALQG